MDRVNGRPCYCSIGAGGTPCIDRKYCDALREIERLRADIEADWEAYKISKDALNQENDRLRRDYAEVQHKIGEYVDLTGRLRAALELYGHHLCTCSSMDKMDSGTLFHRSDWPCDCGFKEAHCEALQEGE